MKILERSLLCQKKAHGTPSKRMFITTTLNALKETILSLKMSDKVMPENAFAIIAED